MHRAAVIEPELLYPSYLHVPYIHGVIHRRGVVTPRVIHMRGTIGSSATFSLSCVTIGIRVMAVKQKERSA